MASYFDLSRKVTLITGGSRGISFALYLASDTFSFATREVFTIDGGQTI